MDFTRLKFVVFDHRKNMGDVSSAFIRSAKGSFTTSEAEIKIAPNGLVVIQLPDHLRNAEKLALASRLNTALYQITGQSFAAAVSTTTPHDMYDKSDLRKFLPQLKEASGAALSLGYIGRKRIWDKEEFDKGAVDIISLADLNDDQELATDLWRAIGIVDAALEPSEIIDLKRVVSQIITAARGGTPPPALGISQNPLLN